MRDEIIWKGREEGVSNTHTQACALPATFSLCTFSSIKRLPAR